MPQGGPTSDHKKN